MMPHHRTLLIVLLLAVAPTFGYADEPSPSKLLAGAKRIIFLGDSITAAGDYVAYFDAWLTGQRFDDPPVVINGGLPSETVSGLSEEGHADGKFPRPDLFERLDRFLKLAKPDLVVACYGINCGVYQPLNEERFEKYREGMSRLKQRVEDGGARFVVMTPPFYDDLRSPQDGFEYNTVLAEYSKWLRGQREHGWRVIDLHNPMTNYVHMQRESNVRFTLQPDGVHPNDAGHWFIAQTVIGGLGEGKAAGADDPARMLEQLRISNETFELIQQRMKVRRDAYVGEAGHKRPGVPKGLPVGEAEAKAEELTKQIEKALR